MEGRVVVSLCFLILCVSLLDFASSSQGEKKEGRRFVKKKCQTSQANHTKALKAKGKPFCGVNLDKAACWGPMAAGMSQAWPCPRRQFPHVRQVSISYSQSMTEEEVPSYIARAVRTCDKHGNWTTEDADLSRCYLNTSFKKWRLILSYGGNGFSLTALIIAMGIFFHNKNLLTLKNQIHCHFFLALCIQIISHYLHQAYEATLLKKTSMPVCYSLLSLNQFSWLSSFCWLLMEGFYIILVSMWIFGLDTLRLWNFGIMAWGVPVYLTITWIFVDRVRASRRCDNDNQETKMDSWYIDGPIFFSLAIGCGISCFCIHKLLREKRNQRLADKESLTNAKEDFVNYQENSRKGTKRSQAHLLDDDEDFLFEDKNRGHHKVKMPIWLRKAMISYLVLMAYHLMYAFFSYVRVPAWLKQPWVLGSISFRSLQGFIVALMLCFLNYDVRTAHSESFRAWRERRRGLPPKSNKSSEHASNYSLPT